MFWFNALILFLLQATEAAPAPGVPESPGIYYLQNNTNWISLQPAVVADASAEGMELFVYTGGYTDMGMDIACRGPRASVRILLQKPILYVRGIGSIKDAMLVRLTKKKDRRVYKTSFSNVTVENKGGFKKQDIYKLNTSENADGSFSISPEKTVPPGEYLLVFGNTALAYDFGIDKAK
jgi:hypothetical protein